MDRQEIAGLVVAVEDWINTDHEERLVSYGARFSVIERGLEGVSGVKEAKVVPVDNFVGLLLHVVLDTEKLGRTAHDIAGELLDGTPRIRLGAVEGDDELVDDEEFEARQLLLYVEQTPFVPGLDQLVY